MLLVNANRIDILTCMAPGGIAGEIGVAEGFYAGHLLTYLKPAKLHLIDPWRFQAIPDYVMDANNTSDEEGDRRCEAVRKMFAEPISSGVVEIHRGLSTEVVDTFPDGYFDFLHVDAIHTYEGCLADLRAFDKKVKRNGLITGHDFQTIPIAKAHHNGVVRAVNDFVTETGYTFLALTFEEAPTYVIAKDPDSPAAMNFVAALAKRYLIMAQIANAEQKAFEQVEVPFAPQKYIFSFN